MATTRPRTDDHVELIERGLALHEAREYEQALLLFKQALALCPRCPSAIYNRANTSYMLGTHEEAQAVLLDLVSTPEGELRSGCPELADTPRSLVLDAYNLLFLNTLHATRSWRQAAPFLRRHLRRRARGLRSLWSRRQVVHDAEELRQEFAPKAIPVSDWVL